jgi:hypothetical protein
MIGDAPEKKPVTGTPALEELTSGTQRSASTVEIISAVNDDLVLTSCLLMSPDLARCGPVVAQRGWKSASLAYNAAIDQSTAEVMVFVHQDVFLPAGWLDKLNAALAELARRDPEWGVLGLYGMTDSGRRKGWVYSEGLGAVLGTEFMGVEPVRTLDEVLLVIRRSSGLRFDAELPGFHMYATDLCLTAERQGLQNYVIPAFAVHNSNGIGRLGKDFWDACEYIRRKWHAVLPVKSPCTTVMASRWRENYQRFRRWIDFGLRRKPVRRRAADGKTLYAHLMAVGLLDRPCE